MYHRKRKPFTPLPSRSLQKKVQLKTEYIKLLEEKAAEKGVSKQELFEELVDRYLEKVKIWS